MNTDNDMHPAAIMPKHEKVPMDHPMRSKYKQYEAKCRVKLLQATPFKQWVANQSQGYRVGDEHDN